ncbi:MAG: hypothetical protein JF593_07910 [Novosphingobium sp.]|nr:hypothetical protein [Novosphingobium sp.]
MKKLLALAIAAGAALAAVSPATAREGCGPGFHRDYYGHCRPNRGPALAVAPGGLVIGTYYNGRGYWDGRRYWHHRRRWHDDWRYY